MTIRYSTVGIVGTGAMGRGIAQIAAQAGSTVQLFDLNPDACHQAQAAIAAQWDKLQEKGRIDADTASACKARLQIATRLADLHGCDLVVEAAAERLDIKQSLFA